MNPSPTGDFPPPGETAPAPVRIEPLAAHHGSLPLLAACFEAEWPGHYGPEGPGSALRDLEAFADPRSLPVGVIALLQDEPCGAAALKADSIPTHRHLTPWAAAGWVHPSLRGRGIGALLLAAVEEQASLRGFERIYCGTSTSEGLLRRGGWRLDETVVHDGQALGIYSKALDPVGRAPSGLP
jgi:GNAT superfamily N-acetyltransferase